MNIILIDDVQEDLEALETSVKEIIKDADINSFSREREAIRYAKTAPVDIIFLEIQMKRIDGITIAKRLSERYPRVNIIFCTGSLDYTMEALDVYCSAYLVKPITPEKIADAMKHLRYSNDGARAVSTSNESALLRVVKNGVFEAYDADGNILKFKRTRSKELLEILVDLRGKPISTRDLVEMMWAGQEEPYNEQNRDYLYKLFGDLKKTLQTCDAVDLLKKVYNGHCIDVSRIDIEDTTA